MNALSKQDAYDMFDFACSQIMESNVIMMQQPLTNLMKLIAYNDMIMSCVIECYRGINYQQLLAAAQVKEGDNYSFVLPQSNRAVVGLVSKLLYEFCTGVRNLQQFTRGLYPQEDVKGGFVRFGEDVILPYREAFRKVFLAEGDEHAEQETEDVTVVEINPAVVAEVGALAGDLRSDLMGDNRITNEQRQDLIAMIDGLCEVIEGNMPKLVRPVWLGIRYAFGNNKKCANTLARLHKTLTDYMLVE